MSEQINTLLVIDFKLYKEWLDVDLIAHKLQTDKAYINNIIQRCNLVC